MTELISFFSELSSHCTFQSNEFWAVEVDQRQQSSAIRDILQQVVQQGEVLQHPTRQVISAITHLQSKKKKDYSLGQTQNIVIHKWNTAFIYVSLIMCKFVKFVCYFCYFVALKLSPGTLIMLASFAFRHKSFIRTKLCLFIC